jgi:hypothetical protein
VVAGHEGGRAGTEGEEAVDAVDQPVLDVVSFINLSKTYPAHDQITALIIVSCQTGVLWAALLLLNTSQKLLVQLISWEACDADDSATDIDRIMNTVNIFYISYKQPIKTKVSNNGKVWKDHKTVNLARF